MDSIPVEIYQHYIFTQLLYDYSWDILELLKNISTVSQYWRAIIISDDFINIVLSRKKLSKCVEFNNMKPIHKMRWCIHKLYYHNPIIKQEFIPDINSNFDLLKSNNILIEGNIEKIIWQKMIFKYTEIVYKSEITIFENLKKNKKNKIHLQVYPPFQNNNYNDSWNLIIKINNVETHTINLSLKMLHEYNFKIIGACNILEKELYTNSCSIFR